MIPASPGDGKSREPGAGSDAGLLSALADWLESSARSLDVPGSYADIEDAAVCLRRALGSSGPGRAGDG